MGLSPRGRGNPGLVRRRFRLPRSIPAWAGEPFVDGLLYKPLEVYPRVGGGTCTAPTGPKSSPGLSPRGRGNQAALDYAEVGYGSIPAWAGEPTFSSHRRACIRVYPRVGGGTVSTFSVRL